MLYGQLVVTLQNAEIFTVFCGADFLEKFKINSSFVLFLSRHSPGDGGCSLWQNSFCWPNPYQTSTGPLGTGTSCLLATEGSRMKDASSGGGR